MKIYAVQTGSVRIKRSQVRFQKLARRDGLTGIVNRQHFMDEAKAMLQACSKASRRRRD